MPAVHQLSNEQLFEDSLVQDFGNDDILHHFQRSGPGNVQIVGHCSVVELQALRDGSFPSHEFNKRLVFLELRALATGCFVHVFHAMVVRETWAAAGNFEYLPL